MAFWTSVASVLCCVAGGLLILLFTGQFGKLFISSYEADSWRFDDEPISSVLYKAVAPALMAGGFSLLVGSAWGLVVSPWITLAAYWVFAAIAFLRSGSLFPRLSNHVVEAALSLVVLEVLVAVGSPLLELITSLSIGGIASLASALESCAGALAVILPTVVRPRAKANQGDEMPCSAFGETRELAYEKRLWRLLKENRGAFDPETEEDPLFAAFVCLVMLVEDINRPAWVRRCERHLCRFPFLHIETTGLMQVESRTPLSDEESVRRCLSLLRKIWGDFLLSAGSAATYDAVPRYGLVFGSAAYSYDYGYLRDQFCSAAPTLYARRCGTALAGVSTLAFFAVRFVENQRYLGGTPERVVVASSLFAGADAVLGSEVGAWQNGLLVDRCCEKMPAFVLRHRGQLPGAASSGALAAQARDLLHAKAAELKSRGCAVAAACDLSPMLASLLFSLPEDAGNVQALADDEWAVEPLTAESPEIKLTASASLWGLNAKG